MLLANPRILLHLEGAVVLIAATLFYFSEGGSWWLFLLLLFSPDLSMLGYTVNVRLGSQLYNLAHTYLLPLVLLGSSLLLNWQTALLLALVWLAHIGLDRLLGYGLKYPTEFKDTHLNRV